MNNTMCTSEYIERESRIFSLYTITSRAIPYVTDGLKPSYRRALWVARNGEKYKTATLGGLAMSYHPHGEVSEAINTITGPYCNNIPYFKGVGAFGTLIQPTAYGASRYTSVTISQFTKDVLFADIDIIPMQENYDGTLTEPKYFLPLIPTVLLNPVSGIAVGFACDILPRSLDDIITEQINFLNQRPVCEPPPTFHPTGSRAFTRNEKKEWVFKGELQRIDRTTVKVTKLPYGISHEKYINKLLTLCEKDDDIVDVEDNSQETYDIQIKFKKGTLSNYTDDTLFSKLFLTSSTNENLNVLDFECESVWSTTFVDIIEKFTTWRLQWYLKRYERLADIKKQEIQKYRDILTAISKNVGSIARKVSDRAELKDFLLELDIVNVDYIADLPVYRFTEQERVKVEQRLSEALTKLDEYNKLIQNENLRKDRYIADLEDVLKNYNNGKYITKE